ncbi:MAG: hypothetical protein LH467_07540 [Gemmatimonadaceae bacterium]|nr:hypothetical protein [Gemmatimonadaceae bacterium]
MRQLRAIHAAITVTLTLVIAVIAAAQQTGAPTAGSATSPRPPQDVRYSSSEADFVVGRQVHLRSTRTFIGRITAVDDDHGFPPDRFPRARMKAVRIERRDGPVDWVPVERITRIYVVR